MPEIKLTTKEYNELENEYLKACNEGLTEFTYKDKVWVISYVKYLLEYYAEIVQKNCKD